MLLDSYIRQERRYLSQESKKFIEEFPQVSQFLADPYFDPDVNRTLDGLSYLSGLLQAKLDREYPQLTINLMDMLWPNYLQHTPSMTIIEFNHPGQNAVKIDKQATVLSKVKEDGETACTFSITRDTWLTPFSIERSVKTATHQFTVDFVAQQALCLAEAGLDWLRLFVGQDSNMGLLLYLYLAEYLDSVTLIVDGRQYPLPDLTLRPVGFEAKDAILRYPGNTFAGYRLLHEYFSFTEGFLFFDVRGFPDYLDRLSTGAFSLAFSFSQPLPATLKLNTSAIKVNCAPVINLFEYDCEPICVTGSKAHYPLYIDHRHRESYELFAIQTVSGWCNNQSRRYSAFDSFEHQLDYEKGKTPLCYQLNRQKSALGEEIDYSLSFRRGDESELRDREEIVSIRALCSNRNQAQALRIGDICVAGEHIPAGVTFSNVTYPSPPSRNSLDGGQQWTTISSLSLNYLSFLNRDSLCQLLKNYNFTAHSHLRAEKSLAKLLDNILSFESQTHQQYYRDLIIEGHKSTLTVSPSAFSNSGEMYLFGAVIAHFYSQYATVNSFHFLALVNSSTHEVFQWQLMNT